jgi:CelD/BcsL family acetyltransferase involved in cellulose biosynthesis
MASPPQLAPAQPQGALTVRPGRLGAGASWTVVDDPAEAERLRPAWADLLGRADGSGLTQSPDWLLTWWDVYGRLQGRRLRLVLFHASGRLVGLAPLVRRRHWHRGVLPFRRLELLGSGERENDAICSNHLGVIAERGAEEAVAGGLASAVVSEALGTWDEVVLTMMDGDGPMAGLLADAFRTAGLSAEMVEIARAPYVPLPSTWEAYLAGMTANRRRHLTRSLRAFDEWAGGEASLECATDAASLERGKEVLVRLHHARWRGAGRSGTFRSPPYLQFHDAIMRWLLERGELELLWLVVRGEPAAALYGMRYGHTVHAYQTGRRLDLPAGVRPGGVLLAYAIRRAIEAGLREFDLLADEAPYKLQLAPAVRSLVQLRVVWPGRRESARLLMERCVRFVRPIRRAVRDALGRARGRRAAESAREFLG